MKITLLGTGTSSGVPLIGCECPVCTSFDARNRRRRTSLYVQAEGTCLLVDVPPDFREQALQFGVRRVDAVLFTHAHADHVCGFDDIRRYNTLQDAVIPAFADAATLRAIRTMFPYIGTEKIPGHFRPRIDFREVSGPFAFGGIRITPVPVVHGADPAFGFRFDAGGRSVGYVPDCHRMPGESVALLRGVDVMVLDALKRTPHKTHLSLDESVSVLKEIAARRSLLVHMGHDLDHAATEAGLPPEIRLSFDGMAVEW